MSEFEPISIDAEPVLPHLISLPEASSEDTQEPPSHALEFDIELVAELVHTQVATLHAAAEGALTGTPTEAAMLAISMNLVDVTTALSEISGVLSVIAAQQDAAEAARQNERAWLEAKLEGLIREGLALIATPTASVHVGPEPKARKAKAPPKAVRRKSSTGKRAR